MSTPATHDAETQKERPMSKFYIRYNQEANSYSVFERGRTNDFGEPYCHVPLVTREEAELCMDSLNRGEDAYAWMKGTGYDPDGIGFDDSPYISDTFTF